MKGAFLTNLYRLTVASFCGYLAFGHYRIAATHLAGETLAVTDIGWLIGATISLILLGYLEELKQ